MLFILIIVLFVLSLIGLGTFSEWSQELLWGSSAIASLVFGVIFVIMSISMIISYIIDYRNTYIMGTELQSTLNAQRASERPIENAAITKTIYEFNTELALYKYWNNNIWIGIFYDDKVCTIKPIK